MNRNRELNEFGQSIWYDAIQRRLLENGEMKRMIDEGELRGMTSNPSLFQTAIVKSNDYDAAIKPMAWSGWNAEQIFYQLAVEDIRMAADLFRPLYDRTNGGDGYVSMEVSPDLAHDAKKTAAEAMRLWKWVNRPNLMIKIPATKEGIEAIQQSIAAGININITLIFSLARYAEVIEAYMSGLEQRLKAGLPVGMIASVASFFVSRIDTKVDTQLQEIIRKEGPEAEKAAGLLGKAAIANARLAYSLFEKEFATPRFKKLAAAGARLQRPLWASTSTKNPAYPDVMYVEELIGKNTVNTIPPHTLDAFRDHGVVKETLRDGGAAQPTLDEVEKLGISMAKVTQELEDEGVSAFMVAFNGLLKTIDERRSAALSELGPLQEGVAKRVAALEKADAARRLFEPDPAFWTADPAGQAEVRKRVGWLDAPAKGAALLPEMRQLLQECQAAGYTHALLLGMGGSSLAPEVMALTLGVREIQGATGLELSILDSTDPGQVKAAARRSPVEKTLYIVSSKSGSTSEITAFFDYFWQRAARRAGRHVGDHFVAITDPGTSLEKLAQKRGFRRVFQADPNVGGRYSALTAFGLVPATLLGQDVEALLGRAAWMAEQCTPQAPLGRSPGAVLGAILGEAALQGRDKLTLLTDESMSAFGSWVEQLVAESSGKEGKGIVPVDLEPKAAPAAYSQDRLFVYLRLNGELDKRAKALLQAGQPVVTLPLAQAEDLFAEFYRWELAVAVACAVIGVNAFDQPDVQDSKTRTAAKIAEFKQKGGLVEGKPTWQGEGALVFGKPFQGMEKARTLAEVVQGFVDQAKQGDFIAINAYLPRNSATLLALQKLRQKLLQLSGKATTLGFGPRFQHSTGQLHKGGPNEGLFIQITADPAQDVEIPGEGLSFMILERAQALGDLEALQGRGRRAIRIHLEKWEEVKKIL